MRLRVLLVAVLVATPLAAQEMHWQKPRDGKMPQGAVVIEKEADRRPVYVCRVRYMGRHRLGQVRGPYRACEVLLDAKKAEFEDYEIGCYFC